MARHRTLKAGEFLEWDSPLTHDILVERLARKDRDIMAKKETNGERRHKATYCKDKYTGGWTIRVVGPQANRFAGRIVPVKRADESEEQEQLKDLRWTGPDKDVRTGEETGLLAAIYNFEPKPKGEQDEEILF